MAVEIVLFLGAVAVVAVVGIVIGMLVARPLDRVGADIDEEPGGDDRTDD